MLVIQSSFYAGNLLLSGCDRLGLINAPLPLGLITTAGDVLLLLLFCAVLSAGQ